MQEKEKTEAALRAASQKNKIKYAFWGTGPLAESALYTLYKNDFIPEYIFTKPDAEVGREKTLTAPMIKKWGESKDITVIQPSKLKPTAEDLDINNTDNKIDGYNLLKGILSDMDVCIVASYGKIIPAELLSLPKYGFINIHPSDLPEYRGPSPIESQLLANYKELVISIMKLDVGMDSGDIIIKNKINIDNADTSQTLEIKAGQVGGAILSDILTDYVGGNIKSIPQDNNKATFCKFVKKEDSEIKINVKELSGAENIALEKILEIKNKYRAYTPWPGIFFFLNHMDKDIRVKINKVELEMTENILNKIENNTPLDLEDVIISVTPEGKKEMSFGDFKKGYVK